MSIKRPKAVSELIRTLDPEVPFKEFQQATHVEALQEIVDYIRVLERSQPVTGGAA